MQSVALLRRKFKIYRFIIQPFDGHAGCARASRANDKGREMFQNTEENQSKPHDPLHMRRRLDIMEVAKLLGYKSRTTVRNRMNENHPSYDPEFPKPDYFDFGTNFWELGGILAYLDLKRGRSGPSRQVPRRSTGDH
ncbi:hypothetical protein [Thiomonas sp. FB-Cd]|uniref:hypothetical protein n=1 Tax=Thiomonas sp. FB-Cd TaxID=1158292 RepID=UPI0018CC3752|nr:hypothetical protein [Thiomonas sp. FB-Cd]